MANFDGSERPFETTFQVAAVGMVLAAQAALRAANAIGDQRRTAAWHRHYASVARNKMAAARIAEAAADAEHDADVALFREQLAFRRLLSAQTA